MDTSIAQDPLFEDTPNSKRCSKCGEFKRIENFDKKTHSRTGYRSQCKECRAKEHLEHKKTHPIVYPNVVATHIPEGVKRCTKCKESKPYTEFCSSKGSKDGFAFWCRACYKANCRHNPHSARTHHLNKRYNLTIEEYTTMFEQQHGLCACCGKEEISFDKRTNALRRLAVDHCHKTGKVRELLCYKCNIALGSMEDDPERIKALLAYAEKWQTG